MSATAPLRRSRRLLAAGALAWLAAAGAAQTTFVNVAAAVGADVDNLGRGAAMVDLDGDGLLDLVGGAGNVSTSPGEHLVLRQKPDHTFEDVAAAWGLAGDDRETFGVLATDFDGDGDTDLYMINGGFTNFIPNQLLRNDLDTLGVFTDVTATSGDAGTDVTPFGGTVLDYDRDGDLDIFLSVNAQGNPSPCLLLRNDGDLLFTDVSAAAGITTMGNFRHSGAGDIDNDGWPDIGVGAFVGDNLLYHNNGDGTFSEIAASAGVASPDQNYGVVFADFDNDGWLDVFLPKWQLTPGAQPTTIMLNDGDLTFTDISLAAGLGNSTDMGHNVSDVDADGHPDLFIGTGSPLAPEPDILYYIRPDGAGGLLAEDGSFASGANAHGPTRAHGVVFGDYDDDGDVDVYLGLGGMSHALNQSEVNVLLQNQGNGRPWLGVDLTGVISSRAPVGARSHIVTDSGRQVHLLHKVGSGFCNSDSPTQHFGLGADTLVRRLVVRWPSGITQTLLTPAVNTRHVVVESGMRVLGTPAVGATLTLQFCGAPTYVAELLIGAAPTALLLPAFGGTLEVEPPLIGPVPLPLGTDGLLAFDAEVPNEPALVGVSAYLQAWIHPPGQNEGGLLSNLVVLTFE